MKALKKVMRAIKKALTTELICAILGIERGCIIWLVNTVGSYAKIRTRKKRTCYLAPCAKQKSTMGSAPVLIATRVKTSCCRKRKPMINARAVWQKSKNRGDPMRKKSYEEKLIRKLKDDIENYVANKVLPKETDVREARFLPKKTDLFWETSSDSYWNFPRLVEDFVENKEKIMSRLSEVEKAVFNLRFLGGIPDEEVGVILRVSRQRVNTAARNIRKKVVKILGYQTLIDKAQAVE